MIENTDIQINNSPFVYDRAYDRDSEPNMPNNVSMGEFYATDRGYSTVIRKKENARGFLKDTKVDVFSTSNACNSLIRNAETGQFYPHRFGSSDEHMYFKVSLSTGELKNKNSSNVLFYDSPKQYEMHLNAEITEHAKRAWEEKRNSYINLKRSSK